MTETLNSETPYQGLTPDKLSPRQRLSHKLRDGAYRARQLGHTEPRVKITDALGLLDVDACHYCGTELNGWYDLDHITPLERGGKHEISNLCKACTYCNKAKGTMTADEFMRYLAGGFSVMQEPLAERID